MPVTPLRPSDPTQVGPHRLLGRLGQGGMGTVFLGVSPDERAVAVKVLRDGFADPDSRRRFRHELEALRRVRGPHLVEVLDADVEADTPYLVTRFVPGTRLDDLVTRGGPLGADGLRPLARGLADALTALHAAGVVHRDLTPGNVLVLDGQPHVIDLGLATAADVTALTRSGLVIGTPGYLAPEQVTGSLVTPAIDVHAWGAVLAFAGTGRPPFGTGRPEAVLYRIVHGEPDLDGLPAELAGLVGAAMDPDPLARPTARELLARFGGTTAAAPVTVHLPRDVDATTVLTTGALGAGATEVLSPAATRSFTGPVAPALPEPAHDPARELAGATTGPQATPAWTSAPPAQQDATRVDERWPYDQQGLDASAYDESPYDERPDDDRSYDGGRDGRWPAEQAYDDGRWSDEPPYDGEGSDDGLLPYDDEPAPPRLHPARSLQVGATALAGLALVAAGTLVAPVVGAATALLLLVVLRATGRGSDRLRDRRERRGGRRRDPVVAALGAPWHGLLGLLDTLVSLPLLLLLAAVPAGLVWLTDPTVPGLERPELAAAAGVVTALVAGLGRRVHRRSRRMLRSGLLRATPGAASAVVVLLLVTSGAVLLLATAEGAAPVWWPVEQLVR